MQNESDHMTPRKVKIISRVLVALFRVCSIMLGQMELVRQRRMARAMPMMINTGNDAGSAWAIAKMSALMMMDSVKDMPRRSPMKTKLRKKTSSQVGAMNTAAASVVYVEIGMVRPRSSTTWSFVWMER